MTTPVTELPTLPQPEAVVPEAAPATRSQRIRDFLESARSSAFLRNVIETYATQISLVGISLVTTVAVTRALRPEGRGLYAVAITVGTLGVQFGNFGLPASNTYYLSRDRSLLPRLLGNSLLISAVVGGLGSLIAWFLFAAYPGLAPVHGTLLKLGLAWVPIGLCFLLLQRLNLGLYEVRAYNKVEVINRCCALVLIGAVILSRRISPEMVITANLLALSFGCFWALRNMRPYLSEVPRLSWTLLKEHLGLGVKAYVITALSFLHMRIALLMVKYMLGSQPAGYYSVATSLGDYVLMLPSVIALILFPKLSSVASAPEKLRQAKKAVLGTALALVPLLLAAVIFVKPAVRILFGHAFMPATDAFIWLAPGIFMLGVEVASVQFLNAMGYPKVLIGVWISTLLFDVLGNLWAIPHFGIRGAAVATAISNTVALLGVLLVIRLRYDVSSASEPIQAIPESS